MSGILWIVLGVGIGLLTPVLFLRWRRGAGAPLHSRTAVPNRAQVPAQTKTQTQAQGQARPSGGLKRKLALKFHGVSLKPGLDACAAVQALAGQRFLPAEAPAVPLAGCDQQKCQCAYAHHGDRREQGDRRSGWGSFGGFAPKLPGTNRRGTDRDRRSRN